eukprot:7316106-Prorocentrum_lima.AAC.1
MLGEVRVRGIEEHLTSSTANAHGTIDTYPATGTASGPTFKNKCQTFFTEQGCILGRSCP